MVSRYFLYYLSHPVYMEKVFAGCFLTRPVKPGQSELKLDLGWVQQFSP